MKTITKYIAFDDTAFDTREACEAHESQHVEARIASLSIDQVRAALSGADPGLRDALEEIGRRCSVARRDAGEFRRKPKAKGGPAGATAPQPDATESPAPASPINQDTPDDE